MADAVAARFWRLENTGGPSIGRSGGAGLRVSSSQTVIEHLSSLANVTLQAFSAIAFSRGFANPSAKAEWVSI
jgi:hypothetical protein